jgi:hypothetical protein
VAEHELTEVERMQAVDVLDWIDRADHARLVDVVGQRELDEETVDRLVGVELATCASSSSSVVCDASRMSLR